MVPSNDINRINLIIGVGAILMVGMSSEYAFAYAHTDDYLIGYAFGKVDAGKQYGLSTPCGVTSTSH